MRTWGKCGGVRKGKAGKTGDKGIHMMFGKPPNRESDSMEWMWNPATNGVVMRVIIWINIYFFDKHVEEEFQAEWKISSDDAKEVVKVDDDDINYNSTAIVYHHRV